MKKKFCCETSQAMYDEYYGRQQRGGDMPVFAGARTQRGHGLGNILSGLFRKIVLPFVKRNVKMVGSRALKTGMEIADDVMEGKSFKDSLKTRVPTGIKRMASDVKWQSGSGVKRRKVAKRKPVKRKRAVKRQVRRKRQVKGKKYIF
jgi:hypothetical protein